MLVLQSSSAPLSLSLHIAGSPAVCDFFPALSRRSIDDDVLRLAMDPDGGGHAGGASQSRRVLGTERLLAKVKLNYRRSWRKTVLRPLFCQRSHSLLCGDAQDLDLAGCVCADGK